MMAEMNAMEPPVCVGWQVGYWVSQGQPASQPASETEYRDSEMKTDDQSLGME
jgi:hypothetical protein